MQTYIFRVRFRKADGGFDDPKQIWEAEPYSCNTEAEALEKADEVLNNRGEGALVVVYRYARSDGKPPDSMDDLILIGSVEPPRD